MHGVLHSHVWCVKTAKVMDELTLLQQRIMNWDQLTLGPSGEGWAGVEDGKVADLGGDAQLVVAAAQRARLQHAVQQPDEAPVPPDMCAPPSVPKHHDV